MAKPKLPTDKNKNSQINRRSSGGRTSARPTYPPTTSSVASGHKGQPYRDVKALKTGSNVRRRGA